MGIAIRITLFFAIFYYCACLSNASEDVELKDPHLVVIATFAANTILRDADDFGLQNSSSLHRILDAHIVPFQQPIPTQYMLTLELGTNCTNEDTCSGGRHVCEVIVLDEPWNKRRNLEEDKTKCAEREPNSPPEFIDTSSTIASSLPLQDPATKAIASKAVTQMGERRGGKHGLKHIGQARRVMMEDSNSNLYYLTLYISTTDEDLINEVCEVTMEEALATTEQTLQSLRCFTTERVNEGADKFGIARVPSDDLTASLIRHAVLASLAIIDAESVSQFQFKVIGYSLTDARVSIDSGTRDLQLKIGLVPTLCIKRQESEDDDEEAKSCTIDTERDPSMCSITLTQWPWVSDGYLFSDFECEPTSYAVISEELEAYTDEDSSASEEGVEVEEVSSNAVQSGNRRENVEDGEEETEDEEGVEVEEETFVARSAPCLGCPANIDVSSPEVLEMANFALSALENAANSDQILSVARIVKATSQVVSGSLYMLTIELVETNCIRSENSDRSKCQADLVNGKRRLCTVGIWDQPWLNSRQIREPQCNPAGAKIETRSLKDTKAGVVTGTSEFAPIAADDEEAKTMANFALNRLDSFDDNTKKRVLVKVVDGTVHSVGRSKTFNMKIHVALADCPEGSDSNDPACLANLSQLAQQNFLCDVQVLAQPGPARFTPRRLVDSKCVSMKSAHSTGDEKDLIGEGSEIEGVTIQQLTGGHESADKASPYIQSIAEFATSAINERSNGNNVKLVRVIRAETQLVAGKKVVLDVEVGFTNCTKKADGAGTSNCHLDNARANAVCRVTVWDRVWLNDRRVTNMTCDSFSLSSANQDDAVAVQQRPVVVGGHQQTDTMSTEIEAYTDFALAVIEEQSNADEKLKVSKILASSVQIVEGKNVRLSLEVAATSCKKDQPIGDDCPIDDKKDFQICNIQIWDRAWLQEKQVTDLNCQPKRARNPKSEDFGESPFVGHTPQTFRLGGPVEIVKASRSNQVKPPLLGGYTAADTADPSIVEMANFAASSVSQSLNNGSNDGPYTLTKIHAAAKQIVAGVNYKLELELSRLNESLLCKVIILEQSWLSIRQVTNMTCFPQAFHRRAKNTVGGYRPAAVSDAAVKDAATFAVSAMSENSTRYSLMKINNAARQIASKQVNYKLTMQLLKEKSTVICDAIVTEKSSRQLLSYSCRNKNNRRRRLEGGYSPADVSDPIINEMAVFATTAISQATNAGDLSVVKVVAAETQIVSGKNYKLTLQAKGEAGIQNCDVVVYDQSWTKTRKLSSFKCSDPTGIRVSRQLKVRPRRPPLRPTNSELSIQPPSQCVGGYCPIDPNEKAVKEMASFATNSLSRSMNAGPLTLVRVRSAERQVVAGFNYRLDLEFNTANGPVSCKVVVFDQAWTSTRELSQMQCEPIAATPRPPPPILGGYSSIDPEGADVVEMANFATSALSQSSNSGPLSLVKVLSAASQVVAGKNYKLTIQLRTASEIQNCEVVVFDQSWSATRQLTRSNCAPFAPEPAPVAIAKPQIGAYFNVDVSDTEVVDVAKFATTLLSHSMNTGPLTLVTISKASKQVQEGSSFQLALKLAAAGGAAHLSCDVVVYSHGIARQLTYSSCAPLSVRRKRSDQMTGGVSPVDPNSQKIKELADFAVSAISLRSNEPNAPNSVRVLKATKQLVAGIMYTLELELNFVDCPQDTEACTRRQKCTVSLWEQPWLHKEPKVTNLACKDMKAVKTTSFSRRQLVGAITPADPLSEEIQAHAAFALKSIQAQSNSKQRLGIVRIKKAGTQTVSGKKIYLTVEVGETDCSLSNRTDQPCPFDDQGERQLCKIEIWTRAWLNERQVTSLKCVSMGANRICAGKSCSKRVRRSTEEDTNTHRRNHHHHHHRSKNLKKARRLKHMTAFRHYAKEFEKMYLSWDEFERRYKVYRANQEKIQLLNRFEMGTAVYGDTPYSDWSADEYKAHLAGFRPSLRQSNARLPQAVITKIDLPDEFDWRNQSVVTPVKNQGSCGSCWAFSVTGNVEGVYAVRNGELLSLSEQELVDCDKLDSGCNGGLPENAYKAIKDLGGLESESDYPYNGHQNKCNFNSNITRVQVTGGVEISTNETEMAQWLVQNGPISIGINANAMQFYRGGVSHPWKALCSAGGIDHGVLIVGYGTSHYPKFNKTLPYWIVKNSWGTKWGEQGYYRVFRGDGTCGLNQMCTSATLD